MKKKLILISLDALSSTEFSLVQKLPNFQKLITHGAYCPNEYSVYPSLTFPCHASIATGCTPGKHGIISNYLFEPYEKIHHWNFYVSNLKKKALWDYAHENGKTVLNMSWPVSSNGKIRWSMPEMTPAKPRVWTAANFFRQLGVFYRYGTPLFAIRSFLSERGLMKSWLTGEQPALDQHIIAQFQRAVRKYPYDIAMLHVYGMDNTKHDYGINSKEAHNYLKLYDSFLGNLISYVDERAKHHESVCLMITGDHSQLPIEKSIYLNMILSKLGLCQYKNGNLISWDALFAPCDGSSYLYIKDTANRDKIIHLVKTELENHPGIANIFTSEEAARLGADSSCALMVEAAYGYGTEIGWNNDATQANNFTIPSECRGLHGYLPTHVNYQTMFFGYGPSVKSGFEIKDMSITDILPSICFWMNMKIDKVDGKAITNMFVTEE